MAKVKAPALSFGARGQMGKAMVYGVWKGIAWVRQHVVPANPKTELQKGQRDNVKDAVAEWHAAPYNADDLVAWNVLASVSAKIMSGFNRMVQLFVNELILGNVWSRIWLSTVAGVSSSGFVARIYCTAGSPTFKYGTSKTAMPSTVAVVPAGPPNQYEADLGGLLAADTDYYFYWHYGTTGTDYGRTGIYHQKTSA